MDLFTVETVVWAIFFAILAAVVYTEAMQRAVCGLARRLKKAGAVSPDAACTLDELGYRNMLGKALVRYFAAGGSPIARAIVKLTPEPEKSKTRQGESELLFTEKASLSYYLPPENENKSVLKHLNEKTPLAKTLALLAILLVMAFAATWVIRFLGNWTADLVDGDRSGAIGVEDKNPSLLEEQEDMNRKENEADEADKADETDASDASGEADKDGENTAEPTDADATYTTDAENDN